MVKMEYTNILPAASAASAGAPVRHSATRDGGSAVEPQICRLTISELAVICVHRCGSVADPFRSFPLHSGLFPANPAWPGLFADKLCRCPAISHPQLSGNNGCDRQVPVNSTPAPAPPSISPVPKSALPPGASAGAPGQILDRRPFDISGRITVAFWRGTC